MNDQEAMYQRTEAEWANAVEAEGARRDKLKATSINLMLLETILYQEDSVITEGDVEGLMKVVQASVDKLNKKQALEVARALNDEDRKWLTQCLAMDDYYAAQDAEHQNNSYPFHNGGNYHERYQQDYHSEHSP